MAIEPEVLNAMIDSLRGESERLRGLKARIDSLVARWHLISGDVPNDSTPVVETRPDAASLMPLTGQYVNDLAYALTLLKGTLDNIPAATIERFAVRAAEFDR